MEEEIRGKKKEKKNIQENNSNNEQNEIEEELSSEEKNENSEFENLAAAAEESNSESGDYSPAEELKVFLSQENLVENDGLALNIRKTANPTKSVENNNNNNNQTQNSLTGKSSVAQVAKENSLKSTKISLQEWLKSQLSRSVASGKSARNEENSMEKEEIEKFDHGKSGKMAGKKSEENSKQSATAIAAEASPFMRELDDSALESQWLVHRQRATEDFKRKNKAAKRSMEKTRFLENSKGKKPKLSTGKWGI